MKSVIKGSSELTPEKAVTDKSSGITFSDSKAEDEKQHLQSCGCNQILLPFPVFDDVDTLPLVAPRYHGTGCAFEVAVLEKHDPQCGHQKFPHPNRNPVDDNLGSYNVIGRSVYPYCYAGCAIVRSQKGSCLNESPMCEEMSEYFESGTSQPVLPVCEYCCGSKPSYAPSFHKEVHGCCSSSDSDFSCCGGPSSRTISCCGSASTASSIDCCDARAVRSDSTISGCTCCPCETKSEPALQLEYTCCPPNIKERVENLEKLVEQPSRYSLPKPQQNAISTNTSQVNDNYACCPPNIDSRLSAFEQHSSTVTVHNYQETVKTPFNHNGYRSDLLNAAAARGVGIPRKRCTCNQSVQNKATIGQTSQDEVYNLDVMHYLQGYSEEKRKQLLGLQNIIDLTKHGANVSKSQKNFKKK